LQSSAISFFDDWALKKAGALDARLSL